MSRPETPRANEDAQALADREARDKSLRDKVVLENEKKGARTKGRTKCVLQSSPKTNRFEIFSCPRNGGKKEICSEKFSYRSDKA